MNIQFVLGLFLLYSALGSLCGRKQCDSCVLARDYVLHWSGSDVESLSFYKNIGIRGTLSQL